MSSITDLAPQKPPVALPGVHPSTWTAPSFEAPGPTTAPGSEQDALADTQGASLPAPAPGTSPEATHSLRLVSAAVAAWLRDRLLEERRLTESRHEQLCEALLVQLGGDEPFSTWVRATSPFSNSASTKDREAPSANGAPSEPLEVKVSNERECLPPQFRESVDLLCRFDTPASSPKGDSRRTVPGLVQQDSRISGGAFKKLRVKSIRDGELLMVKNKLARIVLGAHFESVFGLVIFTNCVAMSLEAQYRGMQVQREIGYEDANTSLEPLDGWPGAQDVFPALELIFGSLFTIEVLVKLCVLQHLFVSSGWNIFDSVIVVFWILTVFEQVEAFSELVNPMIFRVCRLVRVVRLVRLAKVSTMMDTMVLMVNSVRASMSVLFWGMVLLLGSMSISALILQSLLEDFMTSEEADIAERHAVYKYYGTFGRSMITMFEITLANWTTPCRILIDNVSVYFAFFILTYKCVVGFAVLKVITGVFLHETFRTAGLNDDIMIQNRRMMRLKFKKKMMVFFDEADCEDNGPDGMVSCEEFVTMIANDRVNTWLEAMDLRIRDVGPERIFAFLAGPDLLLTREELCSGMSRLRGTAQGLDVLTLLEIHDPEIGLPPSRDTKRLRPRPRARTDSLAVFHSEK